MIWIEVTILTVLVLGAIAGAYAYLKFKQILWYVSAQMENVTEAQTSMRQHLNTTGRVLGVFEDELQVIQKRRERDQNLKTRFTRTPR